MDRIKVEAAHKYGARIPETKPGEHLWIMMAMFRIADPTASAAHLDLENLITIDGPGCFLCEKTFEQAGSSPCKGTP